MRRLDDHYFRITKVLKSGLMDVGHGHKIHWEESGNPDGVPLLLIHGGPGGRQSQHYRIFTDPEKFRIIQFDQRGCGYSEPTGKLEANSLQDTLRDIEVLREYFAIEQWIVTGGSWGSTVALAYAEEYPTRCLGLLLVSMWLCRDQDMQWWYQGVRKFFPELWAQFSALIPETEWGDLRTAYNDRILQGDDELAHHLFLYEEAFMRFDAPLAPPQNDNSINYGRIFSHYSRNGFFLEDNQLLKNAQKIKDLPTMIVTGRYDMCTTPDNAYDLAENLDNVDLTFVPSAGHNPMELPMSRACLVAMNQLQEKIKARPSGAINE